MAPAQATTPLDRFRSDLLGSGPTHAWGWWLSSAGADDIPVPTGKTSEDGESALAPVGLEEWCSGPVDEHRRRDHHADWTPPLSIALHLVRARTGRHAPVPVAWVGRRVWPSRAGLEGAGALCRSVFIDAARLNERLWASETLLRCGAQILVVLDGSDMNLTMTRRLHLAAKANADAPGLAIALRPAHELSIPSAASARWLVTPLPTNSTRPRWSVELMRCKGPQPTTGAPRRWAVEHKHDGTGVMCVSDRLGDGPGSASTAIQQHRPARPDSARSA